MANNNSPPCACKGIRTCRRCECLQPEESLEKPQMLIYTYCTKCKHSHYLTALCYDKRNRFIDGISLLENFVSYAEEMNLSAEIEKSPWVESQSGRRKQDYGPKVNFKKQKVRCSQFSGLPAYSAALVRKINDTGRLSDFRPVELCNLEYRPETGASIDPHVDDAWLWGERLVSVNLLADTCLTLTVPDEPATEVRVRMPRRSLLVLAGAARHHWLHGVQRRHVTQRRLVMTFRELSAEFSAGGARAEEGAGLLQQALTFTGRSVAEHAALQAGDRH